VTPSSILSTPPSVSKSPSPLPSSSPSTAPTCYGGFNAGLVESISLSSECPLHECAGDCDVDSDCLPGLICFQRALDDSSSVPGCRGKGINHWDYCIKPPSEPSTMAPINTPSSMPSGEPSISLFPSVSSNPTSAPTCYGGSNVGIVESIGLDLTCPLHECSGDCDSDSDCLQGLVCFHREIIDITRIPGCIGVGLSHWDYCTKAKTSIEYV